MALLTPTWVEDGNYSAQLDRLTLGGAQISPGVADNNSYVVQQQTSPNMSVRVSGGHAFVKGTSAAHQGTYHCYNDGFVTLTIDSAHATLDRIDLVVLRVLDVSYSGNTSSSSRLEVIKGVASASPIAPMAPADSLELSDVRVPKAATSISNKDIRVKAPRAISLGGIGYARTANELNEVIPKVDGLHVYRKDVDRLMRCDGRSWKYVVGAPERDTGWQNLTIDSSWQVKVRPQYRVYNDLVYVRGTILNSRHSSKWWTTIGNMPSAYKPKSIVDVHSGPTPVKLMIQFSETGQIRAYSEKPSSEWRSLAASWML